MSGFSCRRCGQCCRWPGAVKLLPGEGEAIAALLKMDESEFFNCRTRLTPDRQYLSLLETPSGACEFLRVDAQGLACCAIEAAKPRQCRDFPEKWNFPGWEKLCKGGKNE